MALTSATVPTRIRIRFEITKLQLTITSHVVKIMQNHRNLPSQYIDSYYV